MHYQDRTHDDDLRDAVMEAAATMSHYTVNYRTVTYGEGYITIEAQTIDDAIRSAESKLAEEPWQDDEYFDGLTGVICEETGEGVDIVDAPPRDLVIEAARDVLAAWESGDLAQSVRDLAAVVARLDC